MFWQPENGNVFAMKKTIFWLLFFTIAASSVCLAMGREPEKKKSAISDLGHVAIAGPKHVELYVTSWCGYCKKLEKLLKEHHVSYERYDIEADPHAAEVFHSIGGTGVPVVRIGSDIVYGYDPDRILELL